MRRLFVLGGAFVAVFSAGTAIAAAADPAPPTPQEAKTTVLGAGSVPGAIRLSDERTITRWANVYSRATIRKSPDPKAKAVGRLRYATEDGFPDIYLALESFKDQSGVEWIKTRVLGRPNGRTGWVKRSALGRLRTVRTYLRINKKTFRATLYKAGRRIWSSRIGYGKPSTPTPRGHFYIRERMRNLGGSPIYGPWAFGTSAYSVLSDWPGGGVVGIHGTNQPNLIPGQPSHGCIRVPNQNVSKLARLMPLGTPVEIF